MAEDCFEYAAVPLLVIDGDGQIARANPEALALFGETIVGEHASTLFSAPAGWAECESAGSAEVRLACHGLPVQAGVTLKTLGSADRLLTVVVHSARDMLSGLTEILGAGGDIDVVFRRLSPFLFDRIPFNRVSLGVWRAEEDAFEIWSRHPQGDGSLDQVGVLVPRDQAGGLGELLDTTGPTIRHPVPDAIADGLEVLAGFRPGALVVLPLRYERRLLGTLNIARESTAGFTDGEIELLQTMTGPLALGIEVSLLIRDLRKSETRYRELYEEAPLMYHQIDGAGRIVDVNRREAEALGYTKEELIGRQLSSLLTPASRELLQEAIAEYQLTGKLEFEGERDFLRKDGSIMRASLSSRVQYDAEGRLLGARTIVRDISQQQLLEERRLQAQKLESLGRMIAGITHEFNNLLGPILGYAQLLQRRFSDEAGRELQQIEDASKKARSILRSMLRFARQSKPQKTYQDLVHVLQGTLELVDGRARNHRVTLELALAEGLPWTRVDETQMTQLFLNLINNSVEAIGTGGKIRIAARQQGPWIQVRVTDTGGGIEESILPSLFDPFFSVKPGGFGTGLGLATCFGIVAEHGGSIHASNAVLDGQTGACFEILLPVRKQPTENVRRLDATPGAPDIGGRRVMVVEDDARYNQMICQLLEAQGAVVSRAMDGAGAVSQLSAGEAYDLLVTDIRMPNMNGIELLGWLQAHRPELVPCVLFVTGDMMDERTRSFVRANDLSPLPKPFELEAFYERVGELIGRD